MNLLTIRVIIAFLFVIFAAPSFSQSTPAATDTSEERRLNAQLSELFQAHKLDQALEIAKQLLALRERSYGTGSMAVAVSLSDVGEIYLQKKKHKEAEEYFSRALDILEKQPSANPILLSNGLDRLAHIEFAEGNFDIAARFLERAIKIREDVVGKNSPALLGLLRSLGNVYYSMRLPEKAEPPYVRFLTLMERVKGPSDPDTVAAMKDFACLSRRHFKPRNPSDRAEEAKPVDETTRNILNRAGCWLYGFETNCTKPTTNAVVNVLNGRAINLPKPHYPVSARSDHAQGQIIVAVLIDEKGNVVDAKAVCGGHHGLQKSSEAAAKAAQFSPTLIDGKPARVSGIITYQFFAF